MSRETLQSRNELVFAFAREQSLPMVVTMGGGYSRPIERAAEAHVDVFEQAAQYFNVIKARV